MNWRCGILLVVLPVATGRTGDIEEALARARAARTDGVPQAAIAGLKRAAAAASGPAAAKVTVELVRCLLESDRENEAIDWTRRTIYRDEPDVIFWRAQALAQKGDHARALEDYRRAEQLNVGLRDEAQLGSARMLEALGRSEEALELYARVPSSSRWHPAARLASGAILIRNERFDEARRVLDGIRTSDRSVEESRRYLLGRLALQAGRLDDARRIYDGFTPRDRRLAAGVAIGQAEALSRKGDAERAEERIESFVQANPRNPLVEALLAKLDDLRSRQRDPSRATLKRWEGDDRNPLLSSTAAYYLARGDERQGRTDRAIRNYAEFLRLHPEHSLRAAATIRRANLLVGTGQTEAAAALLAAADVPADPGDEAKARFLRGATEYAARDYAGATKTFVSAANLDPAIAENALTNAALAAINSGSDPLAAELLNALRKQNAATARRIELTQAFQNAREGNPDAGEQLAWLASRGGAVGGRARLALAEWRYRGGDRVAARSEYRRVLSSAAAGVGDQKDYFAVYLADDGSVRSAEAVAQAARDFLGRHPDSPREADVRMKWGEVLMRAGDYRGARVQFDEAGRGTTDPTRRQSAFFLAARAAAGSMDPSEIELAISLLEEVASQKSGDLAAQARWEQATLQSALGRYDESVKILDRLLATTTDPRLIFAARLKKGDALKAQSATKPEALAAAIKEWRMLAAAPEALPAERNEALTHAAAASEQAGNRDGALAMYYEVLTTPRDRQPEFFWYYKAGWAAAQLLIKRERYKEAIAVYEKMAAGPGPRAGEAKEQVKRLRLENFIWED